MRRRVHWASLLAAAALLSAAIATSPAHAAARVPPKLPAGLFDGFKGAHRYAQFSSYSAATRQAIGNGTFSSGAYLPSFPNWQGAFTLDNVSYPYTMAGRNPAFGGETEISTSVIFLDFVFDEFVDGNGKPIVISSSPVIGEVLGSPNFVESRYANGEAQFGDAVQRASFASVAARGWHTVLDKPRVRGTATIEVPVGQASVYDAGNGKYIAFVGFDFLYNQLLAILDSAGVQTTELPMLVSRNVSADVALGYHDAYEVVRHGRTGVQTYLYTSWFEVGTVPLIFADATTITHEVSEWIADPFINNVTTPWLIPASGGYCNDLLEVGDPIEFLDTQMYPVTIGKTVYHTQNETLLSWFTRDVPSLGFMHAYSFPDTTVLTAPFEDCPTPF